MYPLIEIKSVPIEIQVKTKNASLEYTRGTAEMEISRSDTGGLDIKSRPIKVQLDTYEGNNAQRAVSRNALQRADLPDQTEYSATAAYARMGSLTLDAQLAQTGIPTDYSPVMQAPPTTTLASQEAAQTLAEADTGMDTGVNVEWEDGKMQIRYEMDKLNFDWKIDSGEFKFTPGDIEISVVQEPKLTIKYIGGAIYVPPSSDPNYEPVDVKA